MQKDDDYIKSLKRQNDDIDDLLMEMHGQFGSMRKDYFEMLLQIEKSFSNERSEILKRNESEIKELFDRHKSLEEDFLNRRAQEEEKYAQELDELRTRDANDQAEQKIKLEKEMQILEKCMEDMRAVYNLNEEKLEFNSTVLNEREKVNLNTITGLKWRERRNIESLRNFRTKYKTESIIHQKTNEKLTDEYKKFTKQFKELQKKFKRFEKSDENRFNEIWTMNEHEVRALINKIIQADRVIHVQQLGIPWTPPTDPIFGFNEGGGQPGGSSVQGGSSQLNPNMSVMDSSKHGMSKSEIGNED